MPKIRAIAIYLPQFHPIPENDEWWGKGFTEWTNVTKAKPIFEGHYQPHLPAHLGFYDLRLEEARIAQEKLAKEYGIHGFCYYHYWFNGRRILERPLNEKLKNPKEDLPFMLCWANENWTKVWDGSDNEILLQQNYSEEDHIAHINYLIPFFKDSRYIRIDGKPVFSVYRTSAIPNIDSVIEIWQRECVAHGFELYIIRLESFGQEGEQYMPKGIDAAAEFQPHSGLNRQTGLTQKSVKITRTLKDEISFDTFINSFNARWKNVKDKLPKKDVEGKILDYDNFILNDLINEKKNKISYKRFPCVCPGFDNSSRKDKNYVILENTTPNSFGKWINGKLEKYTPFSTDENLFFINAWNEWAEGNHVEPDRKWGLAYLEQVRKIFKN